MAATVLEWLNLILRWAHVVAAIMWIGDSFLFMWLDSHLEPPTRKREGDVAGELWMTHSGGFYEVVKRKSLRPQEMPERLYWFKWESYSTWITGFFLITVVYYFGGQAMLIDVGAPLNHAEAVALSIILLGAGVLGYDLLCRTPIAQNLRLMGITGLVIVMGLAWALSHVYTPRAVFIQLGAMLATIMSSNVLLRIIPAQKHMLAATRAGTPVDTSYGARAKLRSTHNHYLTLPVLLMMLSNHFPSIYGVAEGWLALGLIAIVGVGVKKFMNTRLNTHPVQVVGSLAALGAVVFLTLPAQAELPMAALATGEKVPFEKVHGIIQSRCTTCHAAAPSNPAFPVAPLGVKLETPEQIDAYKERIIVRTVQTRTMPLGNLTEMTEDERVALATWFAQGGDISGGITAAAVATGSGVTGPAAGTTPASGGVTAAAAADAGSTSLPVVGPVGATGATGAKGATGTTGATGAPGATGAKAVTGGAAPTAGAAAAGDAAQKALGIYQMRCLVCHGAKGAGDGPAAMSLNPKPRRFSDPAWQKKATDEHLKKVILGGGIAVGLNPAMPANPDLESQPQVVDELVKLIRGFKE